MHYLRLLRPQQWVKNLFVFAGLVFGRKLGDPSAVALSLCGFVCLCMISSVVYILNDIHDREEDRLHPRKKNRPIASGAVSVRSAALLAVAMGVVGLGASWILRPEFAYVAIAYLVLQLLYTFSFKHAVILDVITIGIGFVLRAVSGAVLVNVEISKWLGICTFTLCLFMGFSKRRCELAALASNGGAPAARHRRTLSIYTPELLNHMTTVTAGIAIVSFMLYTIDARTVAQFGEASSKWLLATLPLVMYAVFRFAVLVEHGLVDGPTEVLLRDRPFQAALASWSIAVVCIVYLI